MALDWKAPRGFVLSRHEGYRINDKGFVLAAGDTPMPDGQIDVAWPNEDAPFYEDENHKPGPGLGMKGWTPDVELRPIKDGYVPPVYRLHHEDEVPHE